MPQFILNYSPLFLTTFILAKFWKQKSNIKITKSQGLKLFLSLLKIIFICLFHFYLPQFIDGVNNLY